MKLFPKIRDYFFCIFPATRQEWFLFTLFLLRITLWQVILPLIIPLFMMIEFLGTPISASIITPLLPPEEGIERHPLSGYFFRIMEAFAFVGI